MKVTPFCSKAPAVVKKARESSLLVKGARLFNCIPRKLRDTFTGSPEEFKFRLDEAQCS